MPEANPDESRLQHEAVHERIQRVKTEAFKNLGAMNYQNKVFAFAGQIRQNHPDYERYLCYHRLISSTPWGEIIEGDFTGEDSVERFFESMLSKDE